MQIIYAVFVGSVITQGFGKIAADYPGFVPTGKDVDFFGKSSKQTRVSSFTNRADRRVLRNPSGEAGDPSFRGESA
jgi:hypothetical protein